MRIVTIVLLLVIAGCSGNGDGPGQASSLTSEQLVAALRENGVSLDQPRKSKTKRFDMTGTIWRAGSDEIEVFEFADLGTSEAASLNLLEGGEDLGAARLFRNGRLLVLFRGDVDGGLYRNLSNFLGPPLEPDEG